MADKPPNVFSHPSGKIIIPTIFHKYNLHTLPCEPEYVTRDFPKGKVINFAGEGGAGKSYVSLEIGVAVALGVGEFGRSESRTPRTVFYVDMENGEWLTTVRVQAILRGRGLDSSDPDVLGGRLRIIDGQACDFSLDNDSHVESLYRDMCEADAAIVFFDPVMAMMAGDPYNNPDVRKLMDGRIRPFTRSGATAVIDHHVRKRSGDKDLDRGSQDIMGAKAWSDAADEVFKIRPVDKDKVIVEQAKGRLLGRAGPFILGMDLPSRGTPVEKMVSRITDLGEPARNLAKEVAAGEEIIATLRNNISLNAGDLDELIAKKLECGPETAGRARRALEKDEKITKNGRQGHYRLADSEAI